MFPKFWRMNKVHGLSLVHHLFFLTNMYLIDFFVFSWLRMLINCIKTKCAPFSNLKCHLSDLVVWLHWSDIECICHLHFLEANWWNLKHIKESKSGVLFANYKAIRLLLFWMQDWSIFDFWGIKLWRTFLLGTKIDYYRSKLHSRAKINLWVDYGVDIL